MDIPEDQIHACTIRDIQPVSRRRMGHDDVTIGIAISSERISGAWIHIPMTADNIEAIEKHAKRGIWDELRGRTIVVLGKLLERTHGIKSDAILLHGDRGEVVRINTLR